MKIPSFLLLKRIRDISVFLIVSNMVVYPQDNLSNLFQVTLPSVLKIETFDSNGNPLALGTGFFISSDGKAISNKHVFEGSSGAQVTTSAGKVYKVDTIWYKSDSLDLVSFNIINDQNEIFTSLKMATTPPKIGDGVYIIGNPIGLDFTISNGIISSIRQQSELGQIIQTSAPISAGSSGSPLMDMNGRVLGVITFTFSKGQNLNFAISLLDKDIKNGFIKYDPLTYYASEKSNNPDWIADKYGLVRGSHFFMCDDWRFQIGFLRNMAKDPSFIWPVNIIKSNKSIPLDSYVRGYHDEQTVGTTVLLVVEKNLTYVISLGADFTSKTSLLLVSRITNGEPKTIFNYVLEKEKMNSSENRYLEKIGNSKINLVIEDKILIRSIYLEDHVESIVFSGGDFNILPYDIK